MTMRWLEAEARLQRSVPLDAVEKLRDEVLQRTAFDLRGTVRPNVLALAEAFAAHAIKADDDNVPEVI
jgi:hypothetical protein